LITCYATLEGMKIKSVTLIHHLTIMVSSVSAFRPGKDPHPELQVSDDSCWWTVTCPDLLSGLPTSNRKAFRRHG